MQSCTCAFGDLHDVVNISCYNSSTSLLSDFSPFHSPIKEKEAVKDKRTHYDAMDKTKSEQQIFGSESISCIVRQTGPILPLLVDLTAGWQTKYGWILKFLKFFASETIQIVILFNSSAMLLWC